MLSKCANPSCSNPFLYLHKGRLYRMETDSPLPAEASAGNDVAFRKSRRIEYFWLCDECAPSMTLTFKKGHGIRTAPAEPVRIAASAVG